MEGYQIGLESYTKESLERLCADPCVKGVVLGDLLCTKRMFPGGIAEEIRMLSRLLDSGKEAVYQTPLYVTSRNWEEVFSILELLSGARQQVHVIVQDLGVASAIHERYPDYQVRWGRMARDRENHFTALFLKELLRAGVTGMETDSDETAKRLQAAGLIPCRVYGSLGYQTVGRRCYLSYQTGKCDREACRSGAYRMKDKESSFSMTIDGYLLGKRLHYRKPESWQQLVIYAETEERLAQCIEGWTE